MAKITSLFDRLEFWLGYQLCKLGRSIAVLAHYTLDLLSVYLLAILYIYCIVFF
jgi:hypothetical protein